MRFAALLAGLLWAGTSPAEEPAMVLIPAGEFTMGRTKLTRDDKTKMRPVVLLDDRPARKVALSAYRMDATEVTNAQYARFLQATRGKAPYHWVQGSVPRGEGNWPVYNVDWEEARSYCAWAGKRLPTEAEFERAARGNKEGMDYPWGDKADASQARYGVQTGPGPVAQYPPNDFGLFDMAGSVSEWCWDWFDREYYSRGENKDPRGPEQGIYKVIRGGAWPDAAPRVTVFFRNWVRPNQRTPNIGFRCVAAVK